LEGLDESYYTCAVSEINIKIKNGKILCEIERTNMSNKMVRLWEKFSEKDKVGSSHKSDIDTM